ncbi:ABC transporter ATP-binding protein [Hydrocarboniclastica marina]|uniref:ABC transporter ATP-binding protein n=1 Tax=Hydrocarboniclastica marina TaxID=2259620 RepID=A0A4P7XFV2_9ALTE|nr:ABC transporter ATP-binding protein [Hydrocarboniclastica marina]MAL98389.1 ABC transporter [Alteromonadaceae bacterium]QCF25848.1 ABC transporter ATP-binding protein [Hydrocarboniclastica marina]|tara:strand:+ start:1200 stop:2138 length:939 start_codon:yes stop_codon:yes gene_type:complete
MTDALLIQNLRKVYDGGFTALKGVDLRVRQGDFFALLGPNGAGKSTILGIVSSLVNKSSGRVEVFGFDIDSDLAKAKSHLGVVPQEFNFNQFEKVEDIVVTQAGYYGIPEKRARRTAEHFLRKLGLWDKRQSPARLLSGGMKRRLMIARALVHEPRVLILDEPTAGVDIELRRSMWQFMQEINRQGVTIILTTHYLEEAEALCRNIAIIDQGEILKNTSKRELLQQLHRETFVLDIEQELTEAPQLDGYPLRLTAEGALEIEVDKQQGLNRAFESLSSLGLKVLSMRTQSNRLEELFLRLVQENARAKEGTS